MKRFSLLACLLIAFALTAGAQHPINSFFDDMGSANLQTQDMLTSYDANGRYRNDTIVKTFHRSDDVVWSKMVYRIVDLRYRQNYNMNFPILPSDPEYKNFLKLILDAMIEGLPVYPKKYCRSPHLDPTFSIKPDFSQPLQGKDIVRALMPCKAMVDDQFEESIDLDSLAGVPEDNQITPIYFDSVSGSFQYAPDATFVNYRKGQYKFLLQEVVFFDKHTSRMHRKIVAIAPLNTNKITKGISFAKLEPEEEVVEEAVEGEEEEVAENENEEEEDEDNEGEYQSKLDAQRMAEMDPDYNYMAGLYESIIFWIPFDQLRPYMANQFVIPEKNETKRVTYDEFFQKHLYTDYLVGDGNMYNRMITDFKASQGQNMSEDQIKKEQARIQEEMLNVELNLWEY